MATYATIKARVELGMVDMPTNVAAEVKRLIQQAQEEFEDRFPTIGQEASVTYATAEDTRKLNDLPSDWLASRTDPVLIDGLGGTHEILWIEDPRQVARLYSDDPAEKGRPKHILESSTQLDVYPLPDATNPSGAVYSDGNWRVRINYWARLAKLGDGGGEVSTNWFSDNAERYLEYKGIAEARLLNEDDAGAAVWFQRAGLELARLISREKRRALRRSFSIKPHNRPRGRARRLGVW